MKSDSFSRELEIIFGTCPSNRSLSQIQKIHDFVGNHSEIRKEAFWYTLPKPQLLTLCRYMVIHHVYENNGLDFDIPCYCYSYEHSGLFIVLRGELMLSSSCPSCRQKNKNQYNTRACKEGSIFGQINLPSNLLSLSKKKVEKYFGNDIPTHPFQNFLDPFLDPRKFLSNANNKPKTKIYVHANKASVYITLPNQDCLPHICQFADKVDAATLLKQNSLSYLRPKDYKIVTCPPGVWLTKEGTHLSRHAFFILSGKCQVWKDGSPYEFLRNPSSFRRNNDGDLISCPDTTSPMEEYPSVLDLGIFGPSFIFGLIPCLIGEKTIDLNCSHDDDTVLRINTNDAAELFSVVTISTVKAITIPNNILRSKLSMNDDSRQHLMELANHQIEWLRQQINLFEQKCNYLNDEDGPMNNGMSATKSCDPFNERININPKLTRTLFLKGFIRLLDYDDENISEDQLNQLQESKDLQSLEEMIVNIDQDSILSLSCEKSNDPLLDPFPSIICNRKVYGKTLPMIALSNGYQNPFQRDSTIESQNETQ